MRFKGTALLLLLFIGLGGYVYFGEYRGKEDRQKQADAKKKAINVDAANITEISLVFPDRTISGVKKGEKQWEITNPPGMEADNDEWELLASNVPRVEREETVTPNATDLGQFGLTSPTVKVSAKTKDGKTTELLFGGENPRKIYNYAKFADSSEVFLTPSSWSRIFQKTLTDLRNKKVLDFETDDIDSVTINAANSETQFQKTGPDWFVKKPADTKADAGEISTFLSSIRFARANGFAESAVDSKAAGLEPPAARIVLHDAKANANRELLIGKSPETDKYYAKDAARPAIVIIEKDIPEKIKRPLLEWRDKTIAQIDREKTDQIEIHRGAETIAMKKDGSDWKSADGKKLQWEKVSGLLNSIEFEKAKDIIDTPKGAGTYGLDKPKMEIVLKQGATEALRLVFGSDSKNPEGIYIKTSNSPSVKVVSKDVFNQFNVKSEDLIDNTAATKQ
jgi:Domain of unknown function (DUF4340)